MDIRTAVSLAPTGELKKIEVEKEGRMSYELADGPAEKFPNFNQPLPPRPFEWF